MKVVVVDFQLFLDRGLHDSKGWVCRSADARGAQTHPPRFHQPPFLQFIRVCGRVPW